MTLFPKSDVRPRARAQWENVSYTHKKEYAEAILQAKKPGPARAVYRTS